MSLLIVAVILVAIVCISIWFSYVRAKGSVRSLIKSLREHEATNIATAKTAEELNLRLGSSFGKFNLLRDYSSYSLKMLVDEGVVRVTEDGRLFLSEETLALSRWKQD